MTTEIPYVREMDFAYGRAEELFPGVRRIVARNPGLFTGYGTNTYLIGRNRVALIDPGPDLPEHQAALRRALGDDEVDFVLITHRHLDHSQAAAGLAAATGAVLAAGPRGPGAPGGFAEAFDSTLAPDLVLQGGEIVGGPGWELEAVPTPGHSRDHVCYALAEGRLLFTGDHVMGWSTSVVIPPDGDMAAYRDSLHVLAERGDRALLPGHGPAITDPGPYLAALIAHREEREAQILAALEGGPLTVESIVQRVYADVDPRLHRAAGMSVLAHLESLAAEGRAAAQESPGGKPRYRLPTPSG